MANDNETNQLLREIRDLLAEQNEVAKSQYAAAQDRIAKTRQSADGRLAELNKLANRNTIILGLINGALIVAALCVLRFFFPTT